MGSAFQANWKENQVICHELGFPAADHSSSGCLLPGTHIPFCRSLPHRVISKLWPAVIPFSHPWTVATSGLSCAVLLPVHRKAWNAMRSVFPSAETVGGFWTGKRLLLKLSCNLTVTIVLTSRIQCYGSFNNSQVWKLKPVNGKNSVVQDHNYGVFLPEKQSYVT